MTSVGRWISWIIWATTIVLPEPVTPIRTWCFWPLSTPSASFLMASGWPPAGEKPAVNADLGEGLIQIREAGIDSLEAVFADGLRRFDQSGEYAADGALSVIAWLKWRCKLSGGAAAERVGIARQLEQLPRTGEAFARGDLGYQHVAMIARTADHLGAGAVRKAESALLQAAKTHDPGQFAGITKD